MSVKHSDVTRWKQGYITPPPPYFILWNAVRHSVKTRLYKTPPQYFIVLASSVKTKEVKVIDFPILFHLFIFFDNLIFG